MPLEAVLGTSETSSSPRVKEEASRTLEQIESQFASASIPGVKHTVNMETKPQGTSQEEFLLAWKYNIQPKFPPLLTALSQADVAKSLLLSQVGDSCLCGNPCPLVESIVKQHADLTAAVYFCIGLHIFTRPNGGEAIAQGRGYLPAGKSVAGAISLTVSL